MRFSDLAVSEWSIPRQEAAEAGRPRLGTGRKVARNPGAGTPAGRTQKNHEKTPWVKGPKNDPCLGRLRAPPAPAEKTMKAARGPRKNRSNTQGLEAGFFGVEKTMKETRGRSRKTRGRARGQTRERGPVKKTMGGTAGKQAKNQATDRGQAPEPDGREKTMGPDRG